MARIERCYYRFYPTKDTWPDELHRDATDDVTCSCADVSWRMEMEQARQGLDGVRLYRSVQNCVVVNSSVHEFNERQPEPSMQTTFTK